MKHADEGTLHAYLDGELTPDEVTELERHISVCAPCRALLNEARGFLTESDALVLALDIPVAAKPFRPRRRIPYSTLAWAAMVVLALGTGYALRPAIGPSTDGPATSSEPTPVEAFAPEAAPTTTPQTPPATRSPRPSEGRSSGAAEGPVLQLAAGTGSAAPAQDQLGEVTRNDAAEKPAAESPAAPAPAPSVVPQALARQQYAYVDGTPVDTTAVRLNFGRRPTTAPRRITLDEAVTHLGGTIQLIDGLAPQRVELLSGVDVAGADPDREVVRVYYEEPDLGLVTLDQQRPGPSFSARDSRSRESQSEIPPSAITVNPTTPAGASGAMVMRSGLPLNNLSWRTDGVWLSLSSRLTGTALAQLQARVK